MNKTIAFPKIFNTITGRTNCCTGSDSIDDCLGLLLTTSQGELLGDPRFGTNIVSYIYDHNGPMLNDILRSEILRAIEMYEPRVVVMEEDVIIDNTENIVNITIRYYIKAEGVYRVYTLAMTKEEYINEY